MAPSDPLNESGVIVENPDDLKTVVDVDTDVPTPPTPSSAPAPFPIVGGAERRPHRTPLGTFTPHHSEPGTDEEDVDADADAELESGAKTPGIYESYNKVRRTLSISGLQDLGRNLDMQKVGGKVWRRKDEGPKRPRDLDQLIVHSFRGGLRAFLLAYSVRAGVNLVVVLLTILRRGKMNFAAIGKAFAGPDPWRFGAMFGSFALIWKYMINGLRIYNPGPRGKGKAEPWHAALAGAVAGISVMAEKKGRRITFGQQLFVRGLQGLYNMGKNRGLVNIPHGDVLLFGIACGQIMYAWLAAPESLSPGYRKWITNTSMVFPAALPIDLEIHRRGGMNLEDAYRVLEFKRITPMNKMKVEALIQRAGRGEYMQHAPCEVIHPWVDSCLWTQVDRFQASFKWMFPVYAGLHFIPPILLKRNTFLKDPKSMLIKSALGTFRSCSFLATFTIIFQGLICAQRWTYRDLRKYIPAFIMNRLLSKYFYWFCGFCTSGAMFLEEKHRRKELAMYVAPKAMESLWSNLRSTSWVPFVPGGELILTSFGLSMVMTAYQHEPKMLSGLVRSVLWQFVGPS